MTSSKHKLATLLEATLESHAGHSSTIRTDAYPESPVKQQATPVSMDPSAIKSMPRSGTTGLTTTQRNVVRLTPENIHKGPDIAGPTPYDSAGARIYVEYSNE